MVYLFSTKLSLKVLDFKRCFLRSPAKIVPDSENPGEISKMPLSTLLALRIYLQACSQYTLAKIS